MNKINSLGPETVEDKAFGCVLGSFVGDACGAYFKEGPTILNKSERLSEELMNQIMTMPGGGMSELKLGPGQVTEDSELAMCLMWSLVEPNKTNP